MSSQLTLRNAISLRARIDFELWATCFFFFPLTPFFFYVAALHLAPPEMLVAGYVACPWAADFAIPLRRFRDRSPNRDVV